MTLKSTKSYLSEQSSLAQKFIILLSCRKHLRTSGVINK